MSLSHHVSGSSPKKQILLRQMDTHSRLSLVIGILLQSETIFIQANKLIQINIIIPEIKHQTGKVAL